jgi:hypothetical protein
MAVLTDAQLTPARLVPAITRLFELSAAKILSLEKSWRAEEGTPVFTIGGRYTARGWTEWTQGFQFGSAILQFEATDEAAFLRIARRGTVERMASHVSHRGVHDHGFNNVSTYGHLLRLMREGFLEGNESEQDFYELALKVSGAVQAARWTSLADGTGFIHSFNGPHSLFVDTIRSLRSLAIAHQLGHVLMDEQEARVSLRQRWIEHALNTARYNIYYGEGRDGYDVRGRTAHEAIFNPVSGVFRCPSTQQGYSPFSTWTRGLAWALLGFAELLEFLAATRSGSENDGLGMGRLDLSRQEVLGSLAGKMLRAARATADFYLEHSCADGIPMWDTGAPNLGRMGDYRQKAADPFNAWEPVDSSAAAIAAQGFIRLGNFLAAHGERGAGGPYRLAGLTIAQTLFREPYLSTRPKHQGLILHSVYHRPNGWDAIGHGQKVPNGESSMWGDYHARELALLILREARGAPYLTFFGGCPGVKTRKGNRAGVLNPQPSPLRSGETGGLEDG